MTANDRQIAGEHYASMFQHWDFVLDVLGNRYLEGQVIKYTTRYRNKNGLQDLEKAEHFLQKLEEAYSQKRIAPMAPYKVSPIPAFNYCDANGLTGDARRVVIALTGWADPQDLKNTRSALEALIFTVRRGV